MKVQKLKINVIGAGLAGCEASYQLLKRGYAVRLFEMRPKVQTPAHSTGDFAELVCSNSLRSNVLENAVGLLKQEMRDMDSLIMAAADASQIPAGSALAVDRKNFSKTIMERLQSFPDLEIVHEEVTAVPEGPTLIASGPLTSNSLAQSIQALFSQEDFYFYDAIAPIVAKESIDFSIAYYKSRYDKGEGSDYINCPMDKAQFDAFYDALITAECAVLHEFETPKVFEGCMPFEVMAKRGRKTLLYGPMKPVGLEHEGWRPYGVVQLRQDDVFASLYNIVGFQTHLTYGEQNRIIHMIPGLQNAKIIRYGQMHRNSYINSPVLLNEFYQAKDQPDLFFAGQMTGVEGYVESAGSGLVAGLMMASRYAGKAMQALPPQTMLGAMAHYISHASKKEFQPMNANFGILHGNQRDKHLNVENSLALLADIRRYYE